MPRITKENVQGWLDRSKLTILALDLDFLAQLEEEILARINSVYNTSLWVDVNSTPLLIQAIISKKYASWHYAKSYSENTEDDNEYAQRIDDNAEMLINGILSGIIEVPGETAINNPGPSFYPNDASSAMEPTFEDPSLGPAKFSMGTVF